jgi:protein TonB
MATPQLDRVARQAAAVAAVAGLHAAALALIVTGLVPPRQDPQPSPPVVTVLRPPPPAQQDPAPELPAPADYRVPQQAEPLLEIPRFDDAAATAAPVLQPPAEGAATRANLAAPDLHAPIPRLEQARIAALVAGCYPSASRRLGEEGRVLARLHIDATGRPNAGSVVESSGFQRLDDAVDCVVRRLAFHPGRRGGEAIAASIDLPVVFRLD